MLETTLSSTATLSIGAQVNRTFFPTTLSSNGNVKITASLTATEANKRLVVRSSTPRSAFDIDSTLIRSPGTYTDFTLDARLRYLSLPSELSSAATPLAIPSKVVNLSSHGGLPGGDPTNVINAFSSAFAELKANGGGTLKISAGTYDFGSVSVTGSLILVSDLANVKIDARDCIFTLTSAPAVAGDIFRFINPSNVTFWGGQLVDRGAVANDITGAYFIRADATSAKSFFKVYQAKTNGAVGLFVSSNSTNPYTFDNIQIIDCDVVNTYYGVDLTNVGKGARVDIRCTNVRRAVISYHLQDATIIVNGVQSTGSIGSNGYIALNHAGGQDVKNVSVKVTITGEANHNGLVHLYHQESGVTGWFENIEAKIFASDLVNSVNSRMFVLDHENPTGTIKTTTTRGWKNVKLDLSLVGTYSGQYLDTPTESTATGNTVFVGHGLMNQIDWDAHPVYVSPTHSEIQDWYGSARLIWSDTAIGRYEFSIDSNGWDVGFVRYAEEAATIIALGDTPPVAEGVWANFQVNRTGNVHTVSVNSQVIISFTSNLSGTGKLGFAGYNAETQIDLTNSPIIQSFNLIQTGTVTEGQNIGGWVVEDFGNGSAAVDQFVDAAAVLKATTISATAAYLDPRTANLSATLNPTTLSSTMGFYPNIGAYLVSVLKRTTISADASMGAITADLSKNLNATTLSSTAKTLVDDVIDADLSVSTLNATTVTSTTSVTIASSLTKTLQPSTMSGEVDLTVTADLSKTLAAAVMEGRLIPNIITTSSKVRFHKVVSSRKLTF